MITYHADGTLPPSSENWIWVFGSNLAGIHGAGAAKVARDKYGATLGIGRGKTGNSYAIPTKGTKIEILRIEEITSHIDDFFNFVDSSPSGKFWITAVGCGLAGFFDFQIASIFNSNIVEREIIRAELSFPSNWKSYLSPPPNTLRWGYRL
jgi:hypothetical protein